MNKLEQEPHRKTKNQHDETDSDSVVMEKLDRTAEKVMAYSKTHKVDTLAFLTLLIGFLLAMASPTAMIGSCIVGIIIGIYFGGELVSFLASLNTHIQSYGTFKALVMGVGLLTLFMAQPYLFIALAVVLGVRALMGT